MDKGSHIPLCLLAVVNRRKVGGTNKGPEIEGHAVAFQKDRDECICTLKGMKPIEKGRLKKEGSQRRHVNRAKTSRILGTEAAQ